MWEIMTMDELWDHIPRTPEELRVIIKPTFPTYRWGKMTTKTSTTDIGSINKLIKILKEKGFTVRKRICVESGLKYKNKGKFYKIEKKVLVD